MPLLTKAQFLQRGGRDGWMNAVAPPPNSPVVKRQPKPGDLSRANAQFYTFRKNVPGIVGYVPGRGYYSRGSSGAAGRLIDPYAPLTPAQITQQARTAVNAQIDPLLANLATGETGRVNAGAQAIQGYTDSMAKLLAGYQPAQKAAYTGAEASQAASDNALRQLLTGGGAQAASELSSQLGAQNSPVANEAAAGAAAQAKGVANAGYAQGSASLAQLIGSQAADQNYGAKLPGIGAAQGLDALRNLTDQSQQYVAGQRSDLLSKVPGLVQSLIDNARNREVTKANARFQQQIAKDTGLLKAKATNADITHKQNQDAVAARRADIAAANTQINASRANLQGAKFRYQTDSKPNASLSAKYGYIVDQYGKPILGKDGKQIPVAKAPGKTNGTDSGNTLVPK